MHKQDLIKKIARGTLLGESDAKLVLNVVLAEVAAALKRKQRVTLTGFGTFVVRTRKKRTSNNIATGKPMVVPAHRVVSFIAGGPLKKSVK